MGKDDEQITCSGANRGGEQCKMREEVESLRKFDGIQVPKQ